MPVVSVRIPQMGEGLQEARLVGFLKRPGDKVKRDDPLYQMETDKAVMDVECPYDGTILEFTAEEGSVLPIGHEIAKMEVADGVKEMAAGHGPPVKANSNPEPVAEAPAAAAPVAGPPRNAVVPPRTRRLLKEKGLLDQVHLIPAAGNRLMVEDVERFLSGGAATQSAVAASPPKVLKSTTEFDEVELGQRQRTLAYRLARGSQVCVPGTIMVECRWDRIEAARDEVKRSGGEFQPSAFTMMAWCVAQAMARHPKFRSSMPNENTLRTYKGANLGIAVALPGDELVTAMVPNADSLEWRDFAQAVRTQVELARNGRDQATEATTLSITNMSAFGLRNAVPVVVSPSVATLFLGEAYWNPVPKMGGWDFVKMVTLSLTFDHRVINGVGAANFINEVKSLLEGFKLP